MRISEKSGNKFWGLGAELDPHFFSVNVDYNYDGKQTKICKEEDWTEVIEKRVKIMKLSRFRVMLLPDWYNPRFEVYNYDTLEMKSLFKVLELADKYDIDVTLTLWGAPKWWYDSYEDSGLWISSPRNVENFANIYVDVVEEIFKRGYKCVTELTPINEPDWAFCKTDGEVEFDKYVKLCKLLDEKLRDKNLRNKVKLNLSDNTSDRTYWLKKTIAELDNVADMYNYHVYNFGYENLNEDMTGWNNFLTEMLVSTKKPYVLGEFGSKLCFGSSHQSDIDFFERGFLIVRHIINFLNTGVSSFNYWVLFDQYYGKGGDLMELGLWKYVDKDYALRPQYYAYGLISCKIEKNMDVYPIISDSFFTAGTCLRNEKNETVIICNHRKVDEELDIEGLKFTDFNIYVYAEDALPQDDNMIQSFEKIKAVNGKIRYNFEPKKAYVISTL